MSYNPKRLTIKQILLTNRAWWIFYNNNNIRKDVVVAIVKLLSCKNKIRGFHEYSCLTPGCGHIKHVLFTCKSKACSSCGKKSTELWISKQYDILPKTKYRHITFTMPSELWEFFWYNRKMLNEIHNIAATCIQKRAKLKKVILGIFIALHTFGRNMKRNVHLHISTTVEGISDDGLVLKTVFLSKAILMPMWRRSIIKLFRKAALEPDFVIPPSIKEKLNHTFTLNNLFDNLYKKSWIVDCQKPVENYKHIIKYLGSYMKRPPIPESKLRSDGDNNISFKYLDHTTKTHKSSALTIDGFIQKFIDHIPDIGFRMIRYYGYLSNKLRGGLLPKVHKLLGQDVNHENINNPSYAQLMFKDFGVNPLDCVLCGAELKLSGTTFGKTSAFELIRHHRQLALLKKITVLA